MQPIPLATITTSRPRPATPSGASQAPKDVGVPIVEDQHRVEEALVRLCERHGVLATPFCVPGVARRSRARAPQRPAAVLADLAQLVRCELRDPDAVAGSLDPIHDPPRRHFRRRDRRWCVGDSLHVAETSHGDASSGMRVRCGCEVSRIRRSSRAGGGCRLTRRVQGPRFMLVRGRRFGWRSRRAPRPARKARFTRAPAACSASSGSHLAFIGLPTALGRSG